MDQTLQEFEAIGQAMTEKYEEVSIGKMMSSPGIQFKGKNFAFYYKGAMCFRLGRNFDPESEGIHQYDLLSPFKNKPPLKDWFVIGEDYREKWQELAEIALQEIRR